MQKRYKFIYIKGRDRLKYNDLREIYSEPLRITNNIYGTFEANKGVFFLTQELIKNIIYYYRANGFRKLTV